jgi:hypothetical protein
MRDGADMQQGDDNVGVEEVAGGQRHQLSSSRRRNLKKNPGSEPAAFPLPSAARSRHMEE